METKMITIPFEVELAKEIQAGTKHGKIVTRDGRDVRIVCWDFKFKGLPIVALTSCDNGEEQYGAYSKDGHSLGRKNKSESDLMLQVREYTQYKEGDVIYCDSTDGRGDRYIWLAITKELFYHDTNGISLDFYFAIDMEGKDKGKTDFDGIDNYADYVRLATEEEKQQLIDVLKESTDPRAKEYLKRFFGIEEEEKPECEFEPKDWVLGRMVSKTWCLCQFSHKETLFDGKVWYVAIGGIGYSQCIPYNEQTKHLLGTTEDWEEQQ